MADPSDLARAIGALVWKDPVRILDAIERGRGSGAVIECALRGGSMGKAIPVGSTVRVRLDPLRSYQVGEIVAFVVHDGLCVHRIASVGSGGRARSYVITQGDACYNPDPPVELTHIVGSVTEFRSKAAWSPVPALAASDRAHAWFGRLQLGLVALFLRMDVRLATAVARLVRLRKEAPDAVAP